MGTMASGKLSPMGGATMASALLMLSPDMAGMESVLLMRNPDMDMADMDMATMASVRLSPTMAAGMASVLLMLSPDMDMAGASVLLSPTVTMATMVRVLSEEKTPPRAWDDGEEGAALHGDRPRR